MNKIRRLLLEFKESETNEALLELLAEIVERLEELDSLVEYLDYEISRRNVHDR